MNDKKNREPMVIALATGKGGSMKTTSAVFLACALVDQSRGEQHVLVADADVQGDAKDWWYRAAELDDPLPFDVMSAAPADIAHLHGINGRLDDPVDWVLIDSAPYGRALDESVNNADLVVIPSSPSRIDLDQAAGVKDLCDRRGVPAAILLCRTEANTTALRDALAWIDAADIACFETLIPKRQDILNAKSTRPRGSRLHEYRDLSGELKQTMRQLKGRTCEEHELDAPSARPDRAAHRRPAGTGGYRKTGIGGNRNTEKPEDRETERRGGLGEDQREPARLDPAQAQDLRRRARHADPGSDRRRPRNVPGLWRGTMNRIMLLGLLVCISRVALCGVMGVMAETVARRAGSSSLRGLCRLCVVAYALVLVASFAPMDSAQTVVHRAVPLLFLVPNLFIWISMRPSGASMRGTRRRNDADGSADSISCEPMNKENK